MGGPEVPHVSDDTYKKLRKRRYHVAANENMRKRAAGEDVPTCATGAPVKLSVSQRAASGARNCLGPNCPRNIQFFLKDEVKAGATHVFLPISARQRSVLTLDATRESCLMVSAQNTVTRRMRNTSLRKKGIWRRQE